jgi:hypothetical protein
MKYALIGALMLAGAAWPPPAAPQHAAITHTN